MHTLVGSVCYASMCAFLSLSKPPRLDATHGSCCKTFEHGLVFMPGSLRSTARRLRYQMCNEVEKAAADAKKYEAVASKRHGRAMHMNIPSPHVVL